MIKVTLGIRSGKSRKMKKISLHITLLLLLICANSCAGYKPIFDSTNIQFKIINHSIEGNKNLGNKKNWASTLFKQIKKNKLCNQLLLEVPVL